MTGKIMTKSSVITNRLSITMAGLIIMLIIFSTLISQPYAQHINYNKIYAKHSRITAYLEVKILSLAKHENLKTG